MRALIALLALFSVGTAMASPETEQYKRLDFLQQQLSSFERDCSASNLSPSATSDCAMRAKVLSLMMAEAGEDSRALPSESKSTPPASGCTSALPNLQTAQIDAIGKALEGINSRVSCEAGQNTKVASLQCTGEVLCNIDRSLMGWLTSSVPDSLWNAALKNHPDVRQCYGLGDHSQSDCMTELVQGIINDTSGNAKAVWAGVKWLGNKTWNALTGVEDKTSEKMLAVSRESDTSLAKHDSDPIGYMQSKVADLWNFLNQEMKKDFGCARWAGAPHQSQCLQEMQSWDCASCNQRLNAVCGAIGAIGTEAATQIALAYFTGGATAAAKLAALSALRASASVATKVAEAIPTVARAGEVAAQVAQAGATVAANVARLGITGLKQVYSAIQASSAATLVGHFVSNPAIQAVAKTVTYAPSKYASMLQAASKAGYSTIIKTPSAALVSSEAAAAAAVRAQTVAKQMGATSSQLQAVENISTFYGGNLTEGIVNQVKQLSPEAQSRFLASLQEWNPRSTNLGKQLGKQLSQLHNQGLITTAQRDAFNKVLADDIARNISPKMPVAERKEKIRDVLSLYMPNTSPDKLESMVEGAIRAHDSYRATMGSLKLADVLKIDGILKESGIADPLVRRELIARGLCGTPPGTSAEFAALLEKTIQYTNERSITEIQGPPKPLAVQVQQAKAEAAQISASPDATPWDKHLAKGRANRLQFDHMLEQTPESHGSPTSSILRNPENQALSELWASVEGPSNGSTLQQILNRPMVGDSVPVKIGGQYQKATLLGIDPENGSKVLVEHLDPTSGAPSTISVDATNVALDPKTVAAAEAQNKKAFADLLNQPYVSSGSAFSAARTEEAHKLEQLLAQYEPTTGNTLEDILNRRTVGDKLPAKIFGQYEDVTLVKADPHTPGNVIVRRAKQVGLSDMTSVRAKDIALTPEAQAEARSEIDGKAASKAFDQAMKAKNEADIKAIGTGEYRITAIDQKIAEYEKQNGAAWLTKPGQELMNQKAEIEFQVRPLPEHVRDEFQAAFSEINPKTTRFTPGEEKYLKELQTYVKRKSVNGSIVSKEDVELFDHFKKLINAPVENLKAEKTALTSDAASVMRQAKPRYSDVKAIFGDSVTRDTFDSLEKVAGDPLTEGLTAKEYSALRSYADAVSRNPASLDTPAGKYYSEVARTRLRYRDFNTDMSRAQNQVEKLEKNE